MRIKGSGPFAWATIVSNQDDVDKANLLVESLRSVLSTHENLVVAVNLDESHRKSLHAFDTIAFVNLPTSVHSLEAVLTCPELENVFSRFSRILTLPVDCMFLKNCDELLTKWENHQVSEEDSLSASLEGCLLITPETRSQINAHPITHSMSWNDDTSNLEQVPAFVRVIKSPNDEPDCRGGMLEKAIGNYWKILNSKVNKNSVQITADREDCTWNSEPIAVIGTSDSCPSANVAVRKAFTEAGLSTSQLTPSFLCIITSSVTETGSESLNASVKACHPAFSKMTCIVSSSFSDTIVKSGEFLIKPGMKCLIVFQDAKKLVSALVITRVSQAVTSCHKILAVFGPCSVSSVTSTTTPPLVSALDVVEIVRFLNLRGPHVNQPWLRLNKIHPSHNRESAIIPNFFTSSSLVISCCTSQQILSVYPHWTLSSYQRPLQCIAIQGSPQQLTTISSNLQKYLAKNLELDFPNLTFTLNTSLLAACETLESSSRAVIIAKDVEDAIKQLSAQTFQKETRAKNTKLGFLFTGQGSQYPGMGKLLYNHCPVFRLGLDRCNSILRRLYNIDILDVIYENSAELSRTLYSQTAIFCVEYALMETWKSWGITPDVVVGHSLGEFSAAVCAGALEMEDAIRLVAERSRLIDELPRGKMLVVMGDKSMVQELVNEFTSTRPGSWLDFAAINSGKQTVLSGDGKCIEEFATWSGQKKIRSLVLEATHAFHSRHMEPMLDKYRKVAEGCMSGGAPKHGCVYVSGMEGRRIDGQLNANYWVRHTREPVRFLEACQALKEEECGLFIECGPQPVLAALAKMNMMGGGTSPEFVPSIRKGADDWKVILTSLGKIWGQSVREVDWRGFERWYGRKSVDDDDSLVRELLEGVTQE